MAGRIRSIEEHGATERRRVYFIRAGADGPIKIGMSGDPWVRAADLQIGCPEELRILATVDGGRKAERRTHKRFAEHRLIGEWFSPNPDLLAYIVDVARTGSLLAADHYARRRDEDLRQDEEPKRKRPLDPEEAEIARRVLAPSYREERA